MNLLAAASTADDHSVVDHLPETPSSPLGIWVYIGLGILVLFIFVRGWVAVGQVATNVLRPMLGFVVVCILAVALATTNVSGVAAAILALVAAGTAVSFIANGRPG
jgi:hypothetical protein